MSRTKEAKGLLALLMLCLMLPTPSFASCLLEQTISRRQSIRDYTNENVSTPQLLEVLQVAYGFSNGNRNTPRIGQSYSLIIFSVNATASYRYVPETNMIILHDESVNKKTIRSHVTYFPCDASVVLIIVWNKTKMTITKSREHKRLNGWKQKITPRLK
jgi:hypothetical protein